MSGYMIGPCGVAPASGGGGSLARDATVSTGSGNPNAGTTLTISHTPVGALSSVLVWTFNYVPTSGVLTGVTYGGTSMVQIGTGVVTGVAGGGTGRIQAWLLVSPPSGTQNVIITTTNSGGYVTGAVIGVTGGNTVTGYSNSSTANGNGSTAAVTVTSAVGEIAVDCVGNTVGVTDTAGGSQVSLFSELVTAGGGLHDSGSTLPGAGSVAFSWTLGAAGGDWANMAVSFNN